MHGLGVDQLSGGVGTAGFGEAAQADQAHALQNSFNQVRGVDAGHVADSLRNSANSAPRPATPRQRPAAMRRQETFTDTLASAQRRAESWLQRNGVQDHDAAFVALMDTPLTQAHFAADAEPATRTAHYRQAIDLLRGLGVKASAIAVAEFVKLLPKTRITESAEPTAPVSEFYDDALAAQTEAEARLSSRGEAATPDSLATEVESMIAESRAASAASTPLATPSLSRAASPAPSESAASSASYFTAPEATDSDLETALAASLTETGPADPLEGLSAAEKQEKAPALLRSMGQWNSSMGDLMPALAAHALGRPVVVDNGTNKLHFGEGADAVEIAYDPAKRHYSVGGTDVPDNGDCFFHAALLAGGHADWQSPDAVQTLRNQMADVLERSWADFSHLI